MDRRNMLTAFAGLGASAAALTAGTAPALAQAAPAAQAGVKRILDHGKLIVGTRSTTIGFGFKDAQGELIGFDIDLAKAIAKGLLGDEKKIEFEIFPGGAERVPALTSGRVDIVVSQFSVFESRAQVLDFSLPYCNSDFSAIVKAGSPYKKHADLNDRVVTTRQADELRALILGAIPTPRWRCTRTSPTASRPSARAAPRPSSTTAHRPATSYASSPVSSASSTIRRTASTSISTRSASSRASRSCSTTSTGRWCACASMVGWRRFTSAGWKTPTSCRAGRAWRSEPVPGDGRLPLLLRPDMGHLA